MWKKANKDALNELIGKAKDMELSAYTKESVERFEKALLQAEEVAKNETLSEDDQDKVNHAKDDLEKAISQLEEKPGKPSEEKPGKPEDGTSGNKAQSAVKTGDSAPIAVWLLAVLLSAVSMGAMYRMKRKK